MKENQDIFLFAFIFLLLEWKYDTFLARYDALLTRYGAFLARYDSDTIRKSHASLTLFRRISAFQGLYTNIAYTDHTGQSNVEL